MLYLTHRPAAPLDRFVRLLWYFRAPAIDHERERILPSGRAEIILSLSRDFLLECTEEQAACTAPALVVGQRSVSEIVATSDFADLIGIAFAPAALPVVVADRADLFSDRSLPLDDVWGSLADQLRDRLRGIVSPTGRLKCLERFLTDMIAPRCEQPRFALHPAVQFALDCFEQESGGAAVSEVAQRSGWSQRRLSQMFREQVGFTPKKWYRLTRFQRALHQMRAGREIRWAELATECGFYDQAHFTNEFRAFSGIDPSTYSAARSTLWANHVPVSEP